MKTAIFFLIALFVATHAANILPAQRNVLSKLALNKQLKTVLRNAESSLSAYLTQDLNVVHVSHPAEDLNLQNVFFHTDTYTTIELADMKLNNVPVVEVNSLKPNIEFLNMGVKLNLGSLNVGGSFEIANKGVLSILPATTAGQFSLVLEEVTAIGKVGLSLVEDSFLTINYDIQYEPTNVKLLTEYTNAEGLTKGYIVGKDGVIAEKLNKELKYILNKLIKKQLDAVLSEISVNELIGDTKMLEDYREHTKAVRAIANDYVDEVLQYVHDLVLESGIESISIPDINESFSKTILWITWHGEFTTSQGHVANLGTLLRTADVSLEFDDTTGVITVFGSLGLGLLDLGYQQYSAKFMGIGPSGSVGASVGENSLFLKVGLIISGTPEISLNDLHIEYARNIQIEITGLGILDWLVSKIATWLVGLFNDQIVGSLDGKLLDIVANVLPNVDPSNYF